MHSPVDVEMQLSDIADVTKVNTHPNEPKAPLWFALLFFLSFDIFFSLMYYAFTSKVIYCACQMEPIITWDGVMKVVHWGQQMLDLA